MDRLTTNNPQNNFETMLNMVYGKDGWGYIRHGEGDIKITDFCLDLCRERGCTFVAECLREAPDEEKDESLFEYAFQGCPVASVYAALCGYCHTRSRLKMYEDAGMWPPQGHQAQRPLEWEEIPEHRLVWMELRGLDKPIPSILRQTMDNQAWYTMESGCVFTFDMDELGKRWRPWAIEPTDEERAAAPWEDAGDADL